MYTLGKIRIGKNTNREYIISFRISKKTAQNGKNTNWGNKIWENISSNPTCPVLRSSIT
jgi:hypothetical protein